MKEIEYENERVMISDSLADKIDLRQFYEDPESISDLMVTFYFESATLTVPINKIKISKKLVHLNFLCESKDILPIVTGEKINNFSIFMNDSDISPVDYKEFDILTRSIAATKDSAYECDLVVNPHNT